MYFSLEIHIPLCHHLVKSKFVFIWCFTNWVCSLIVPAQEQWKEVITHVVAVTTNRKKVFQWKSTLGKNIVFGCFGKRQSYTRCATSVSQTKMLQIVFSKSGKTVTLTRQSIGEQFLPLPQLAVLTTARDLRYQTSVRCLTAGWGVSLWGTALFYGQDLVTTLTIYQPWMRFSKGPWSSKKHVN